VLINLKGIKVEATQIDYDSPLRKETMGISREEK
jgi:hypothetical protein